MQPHRQAMLSVLANLHQCQELAATRVTDTALTAYASAIALVESELARADQLASQPTGDSLVDDLARLRRMELENIAALEGMIAKLDGKPIDGI